jgi:hypothetical protein
MLCEVNVENITKEQLLKILKEQEVFVSFENKDGEQRRMLCTLKPSYLTEYQSKGTSKKDNDNIIYVWDIEVKGFRAFNINKLDKMIII